MDIKGEIRPLTGLRFVAALWVFLFHFQIRWPLAESGPIKAILDKGAFGMSLFFMLSGFILAYRYIQQLDVRDYFLNRVARIYPVYLAAAIVTLPWIGVDFRASDFHQLVTSTGRVVLLVVANALAVQAWFPQMVGYWNDAASWSISTEAFFYALFPIVLPALLALRRPVLSLVVVLCWLASFLPGASEIFFPYDGRLPFYSMPIFRLPEFVIGVAACLLMRKGVRTLTPAANWAIAAAFVAYLALPIAPLSYVAHNWIVVPAVGLCIVTLASSREGFAVGALGGGVVEWLGRISYCFYSFQALVILFATSHRDQIIGTVPALSNNYALVGVAFVALLCLSALGYYLIEEPCRRALRDRYGRRRAPRRRSEASA